MNPHPARRIWRDLATIDTRPTCGAHHSYDCPWCHTDYTTSDILDRAARQQTVALAEDVDGNRWAP